MWLICNFIHCTKTFWNNNYTQLTTKIGHSNKDKKAFLISLQYSIPRFSIDATLIIQYHHTSLKRVIKYLKAFNTSYLRVIICKKTFNISFKESPNVRNFLKQQNTTQDRLINKIFHQNITN